MTVIWDFLFENGGFSPHGFCIAWNPLVLYLHIFSDLLIASSYFAIPLVILSFLRHRKDQSLHRPAILFALFIAACGLTHLVAILTFYVPAYGFQGLLKLATGVISFVTAISLARMLPEAIKIPKPTELLRALDQKESEIAVRKQAEESLRKAQIDLAQKVDELEAANDELSEFAYAASHDLKSPANSLSLWLDEFREEYFDQLNRAGRAALDDASRLVARMDLMVDDVLSFSHVVNRAPDELTMIDLGAVFNAARAGLSDVIANSGATVRIERLPQVRGYQSLMVILAQNLLSNAVKYVDPETPNDILVTSRPGSGGKNVEISVRDKGIGIDPKFHARIFKLFKRLHSSQEYEGTGLGLALCRRIAITHGGNIRVVSSPGQGAEFIITLPLENTHGPRPA